MSIHFVRSAVLAAGLLMASSSALAADASRKQDAMMAEITKLGAPGPAHEKLRALEGKWKASQKTWMAPGEPTTSEGTCENRMILGGRFLEQRFKGTFMGRPFEGYGLTGYDNTKGSYTMMWVDNTTTAIMSGEGALDGAGQELTMKAMGDGPDGKPTELKLVTHLVDANRHVFSMYATLEGKEQLMMETTYTRSGR